MINTILRNEMTNTNKHTYTPCYWRAVQNARENTVTLNNASDYRATNGLYRMD